MHEIVQSLMTPIPLIVLFFIQILTSVVLQMDVMSMPTAIIIPARIAVPAKLDLMGMGKHVQVNLGQITNSN